MTLDLFDLSNVTLSEASKALLGASMEVNPTSVEASGSLLVDNQALTEQVSHLNHEIEGLTNQLSQSTESLTDLTNQLKGTQTVLDRKRKEIGDKDGELNQLKSVNATLSEQVSEAKGKVSSLRKTKDELNAKLQSLQAENQELLSKLNSLEKNPVSIKLEPLYQGIIALLGDQYRSEVTGTRDKKILSLQVSTGNISYLIYIERQNANDIHGRVFRLNQSTRQWDLLIN
jgi:chromosome segregation ATPase